MSTVVYTLHFDGSCGPKNPGGTAAYGFTIHRYHELVTSGNAVIGTGPAMSNNVAEYAGLYEGLAAFAEWLGESFPPCLLNVRGDSQLVIKQMNGLWRAKAGLYLGNYRMAEGLVRNLRKRGVRITFEWIPRENNQDCDDLSKLHLAGRVKLDCLAAGPNV